MTGRAACGGSRTRVTGRGCKAGRGCASTERAGTGGHLPAAAILSDAAGCASLGRENTAMKLRMGRVWAGGLVAAAALAGVTLIGAPRAARSAPSGLSHGDITAILNHGVSAANATTSALRVVNGNQQPTKMQIAVVGRDGRFLAIRSMDDA